MRHTGYIVADLPQGPDKGLSEAWVSTFISRIHYVMKRIAHLMGPLMASLNKKIKSTTEP